jgi:hypothetical protein
MTYKAPQVPQEAALYTATTSNRKTGNVPTMAIGRTRQESKDSCKGCSLLDSGDCYAQYGTVAIGHSSTVKGYEKKPERYSLKRALSNRLASAKMVRIGSIGDPGALPGGYLADVLDAITGEGLDPVGYTHHWRGRPDLAGLLMASCETLQEADQAVRAGFRAAAVVPWDWAKQRFKTPDGNPAVICPAILEPDVVTCNNCRLCNGAKAGPVVVFPDHGPKVQHLIRKLKTNKEAQEQ